MCPWLCLLLQPCVWSMLGPVPYGTLLAGRHMGDLCGSANMHALPCVMPVYTGLSGVCVLAAGASVAIYCSWAQVLGVVQSVGTLRGHHPWPVQRKSMARGQPSLVCLVLSRAGFRDGQPLSNPPCTRALACICVFALCWACSSCSLRH